ncbi:uncharacterized protein BT62DRAFT_927890 [Guyanagaster necrorhizus]|uniref:Uncharacterized protein n=1 Tax=Guyanagaster necrorhizus TaxID=856835 RepID=A0A9P7W1F2_9AGAR|nr:uncharacterized protein BT62DRAFT_927890 [Guyanagaster necrorhizus MCA 3950]KAG7450610.1 hypothetical protein BT62DRAFT_927890 [Guyanagaster necrorhizus MCA 3950]
MIRGLSADQKTILFSLNKIDAPQGRLCWDRNNELVDTNTGSGNGQSIIPEDIPQRLAHRGSFASRYLRL